MIQAPGTISYVATMGPPLCQSSVVLSLFTSEPHGPLPFPSEPRGSFFTSEPRGLLFTSEPHGLLSSPPKPCGPPYSLKPRGLFFLWLPGLGLNPSAHLPLQPHF